MTRRTLVAVTAVLAVLGFTLATVFYNRAVEEQASTATPSLQDDVLVRPYSPVFGPKDAPVTIVEFFDPSCEACRAFHPIVKQIRTEFPNTVRVVLRYTTFHKGSDEAVRILETARLQGIFEPVLEGLLAAQPEWAPHGAPNLGKAWEAAGAAGLDVERARREMLMPDITAILNQDMADVKTAGVEKTPTFFVNGKPLPSFGAEQLYKLVREEVAIARETLGN
tara:strand:- start:806 stop:1474 length:669 start_codon:yes stop_codon:yes gene_type:complete